MREGEQGKPIGAKFKPFGLPGRYDRNETITKSDMSHAMQVRVHRNTGSNTQGCSWLQDHSTELFEMAVLALQRG
jgi:hypothetical protein